MLQGDLRALVERLKSLPELRSASIIIASLDLLVLVPTHEQTLEQVGLLLSEGRGPKVAGHKEQAVRSRSQGAEL